MNNDESGKDLKTGRGETPAGGAFLHGQIAVVTGAASGIGRAVALELAARGASLILHTRGREDRLAETAQLIRDAGHSVELDQLLADFSSPEEQDRFAQAAWDWRGRIDILVNNAGVDVLTGSLKDLTFEEKLDRLWRVDVQATMRLSRRIGQLMRSASGGCIVNVGWDQAEHGMEGDSGEMFAATKGAVMAFSKSLAKSLAPRVRVNCVAPGWIQTAWGEHAAEYWQQRARRESLLRTWGTAEDVAAAVGFLVSPAARFINGQIVPVNGGFNHGVREIDND